MGYGSCIFPTMVCAIFERLADGMNALPHLVERTTNFLTFLERLVGVCHDGFSIHATWRHLGVRSTNHFYGQECVMDVRQYEEYVS